MDDAAIIERVRNPDQKDDNDQKKSGISIRISGILVINIKRRQILV